MATIELELEDGSTVQVSALEAYLIETDEPFYMEGYEQLTPNAPACPITIVHGWDDDVVPWRNSACFAEPAKAKLVLVDAEHGLSEVLPAICAEFQQFLAQF